MAQIAFHSKWLGDEFAKLPKEAQDEVERHRKDPYEVVTGEELASVKDVLVAVTDDERQQAARSLQS